eukprot:TRINITY_DN3169_c0_g2_i1.p1 TRINITY_DN3169_c0_g2~~TRINITY_DN3169_c0_g2_i1.p1  ORF type:complete len:126 (-),score=40.37 TRINITY_DN3169_c0_g2_i1:124-501(-)
MAEDLKVENFEAQYEEMLNDDEKRGKIEKILRNLPANNSVNVSNPIHALDVFVRVWLKCTLDLSSEQQADSKFTVTAKLNGKEEIGSFTHEKKKFAKERAAKMGIQTFHENEALLKRYIVLAVNQ